MFDSASQKSSCNTKLSWWANWRHRGINASREKPCLRRRCFKNTKKQLQVFCSALFSCLMMWGVTAETRTSMLAWRLQSSKASWASKSQTFWHGSCSPTYKKKKKNPFTQSTPYARYISVRGGKTDEALQHLISHVCHIHRQTAVHRACCSPSRQIHLEIKIRPFTVTTKAQYILSEGN